MFVKRCSLRFTGIEVNDGFIGGAYLPGREPMGESNHREILRRVKRIGLYSLGLGTMSIFSLVLRQAASV